MPGVNILSIQSLVSYGHAGNSAAMFPLQRLGFDVWPVVTVHFSNHTGYGAARGPLLTAEDIAEVIRGVEDRGALDRCDAVLSGYQGAEDVGSVILDAVRNVKKRNPEAIYFCDPVMGDFGRGFFVRPGIPEFMRDEVVPAADVITPNQFELGFLADTETNTLKPSWPRPRRSARPGPRPSSSRASSPTRPPRRASTWSPSRARAPSSSAPRGCRSTRPERAT